MKMLFLFKQLTHPIKNRLLTRKLKWTSRTRKKIQTDTNTFSSESNASTKLETSKFIKFEDMILKRRKEAERSIIVQVHSELSCSELYQYCLQYSPILNMFHYKFENNHFVLVEFDQEVAKEVLPKCTHGFSTSDSRVPVTSPVLWFKAAKVKKLIEASTPPVRQSLTAPNLSDLIQLIQAAPSISDGMKILYEVTKLEELGIRLRFLTARQLELSLKGLFPNCAAIPFGSSVNGFGKQGCDLDLVLQHSYIFPKSKTEDNSRLVFQCKINSGGSRVHTQRQMEVLADIIQVYLPGCSGVKRILQARVPIVKYSNEITGIDCDVSMTNMTGVYMSEVLYLFASIQPELTRQLVFTVKMWAKSIGLTDPSPGRWITNFTLTLLCLFYMQTCSLLPSLDILKESASEDDSRITEDIDCTFCRNKDQIKWDKNKEDIDASSLFRGFLEYYTKFDFTTLAISLNTGKSFVKPDFSPIFVANPLEKGLNVSKNMSAEEVERLRMAIRNAFWTLETNDNLISIISSKPNDHLNDYFKTDRKFIPNRMIAVKDIFAER